MLSLILNMDVRYFLFILIFIAVICFFLWKFLEEELNFTSQNDFNMFIAYFHFCEL